MKHWTPRDRLSFAAHAFYAALAFLLGAAEAYRLWLAGFGSGQWLLALVAVAFIDGICLLGLTLGLARVDGPLAAFGHFLPLVAFGPLAYGAYSYLAPNVGMVWAIVIALIGATWLGYIDRECIRQIERLFTPPAPPVTVDPVVQMAAELTEMFDRVGAVEDAAQRTLEAMLDRLQARSLAVQSRSLAVQAPQILDLTPQVAPQDSRDGDPLWSEKVQAWEMRQGAAPASWSEIGAKFSRSAATVRGWVEQVERSL